MSSLQLDHPPFLARPQTLAPWLKRLSTLASAHHSHVVFLGRAEWGIPRLLQHLHSQTTLWLWLDARHLGNPQAQTHTLLEAIQRQWGSPEVNRCSSCALELLKDQLEAHPSQIVLAGAEFAPDLAQQLLGLGAQRVHLWFSQAPSSISLPKPLIWITPDQLRLSSEEALNLAEGKIPDPITQTLYQLSQGALENYVALCHQHLKLPPPAPASSSALPNVVESLLQRQDWMGALELTTRDYPHLTPLLLKQIERGLYLNLEPDRLYPLLQELPSEVLQHEVVLRWRLESALELGLHGQVMDEVLASLKHRPSAELRAAYARALQSSNDLGGFLREAEPAAQGSLVPQVLFTYGKALDLSDPHKGHPLLLQALRQAEQGQDWFWAVQAALALAQHYIGLGEYRQATRWAEWGLRITDQHHVQSRQSRLWLLNEWAFARLLSGETVGLSAQLEQVLDHKDHRLNYYLRSTLGDVLLVEGNPQEALETYWPLWEQRQPAWIGALSNLLVRALLETGRQDEALEIATEAIAQSQDLHKVQRRRATLALGMVLALRDPARAISILRSSLTDLQKPLLAPRLAQAGLYLSHAHLQLGQTEQALATLKIIEPSLKHLGLAGLRYLSGNPAVFRPVLELCKSQTLPRLELRFLGEPEVRLDGTPLRLGNRACEVLAVLALHPQGLTAEALSTAIYGNARESETIPVLLSGLKQRGIPVLSRPYRLGIEVWADFIELPKLLEQNRLREAIGLLRGEALLPKSESPAIRSQHDHLCKMVHQAVTESKDLEAVLALAQRKPQNPELWGQAMALMPLHDPRRAEVTVHRNG